MNTDAFKNLKDAIAEERKTINEIDASFEQLKNVKDRESKKMAREHLKSLNDSLKRENVNMLGELEKINLTKRLGNSNENQGDSNKNQGNPETKEDVKPKGGGLKKKMLLGNKKKLTKEEKSSTKELSTLEKETIKRLKKGREKVAAKEVQKPKSYIKLANKLFYNQSSKLFFDKNFETLKKDLIKTDLNFTPTTYISIILLSTAISAIAAFFIFLFFLFFNIGFEQIISLAQEGFGIRFLKVFWILIVIPIVTFLFMYFYPSLEKKSLENKIGHELPFAAIHMAAISQSLIEPSKIFTILISTKEYPTIEKEFTKLMNKINIYGYDLVTALRSTAENSPSKKLSELLNGLATTVTSGGDLREFFEKRSQTLLFEHRLEREKETKAAETFMDIYISIVIAAPMVLMLLMIMMRISGLGISLSTSSITLIIVLGVAMLNIVFLSFLHLKKSSS